MPEITSLTRNGKKSTAQKILSDCWTIVLVMVDKQLNTNTTFFLELGRRSPAGPGKLEMTHKVLQFASYDA